MSFLAHVQPLLDGSDLTSNQAADMMGWLLDGKATESQIGAVITALKIKGVTAGELAAFAQELRKRARLLHLGEDVVDTCGTGGGGSTFNISTAAAFVAAGAGVKIAKHGNRSVTSKCGSADVLEALGAKLQDDLQMLEATFRASGIVFMFAPVHHPGMRHVGKSRKELGFRSVFNQLGPLANPAGAKRQMIGVYNSDLVEPMAKALGLLGVERAVVIHGDDGLDELSPCEKSKAAFVMGNEVRLTTIGPAEFGLEAIDRSALECGETAEQNAEILREAISDSNSARCHALLPSSAMAIWLSGGPNDLIEARDMALESVQSGRALESLEKFVEATNRV